MSRKCESVFKTEKLSLSLCKDGYWLHDKTRGMNLAMRASTEREAFIEALGYYHRRLPEVEQTLKEIRNKVEVFVGQFTEGEDNE